VEGKGTNLDFFLEKQIRIPTDWKIYSEFKI